MLIAIKHICNFKIYHLEHVYLKRILQEQAEPFIDIPDDISRNNACSPSFLPKKLAVISEK